MRWGEPTPVAEPGTDFPSETGVREIQVEASKYKFKPNSISVKAGEKVVLKVKSRDIRHTFTVDELGIDIHLAGGQTIVQEFTAPRSGTFRLYCEPHRNRGQVGTFKVTGG